MKYKTVWLIIIFVLSSFVVTFAENSIKAEVDKRGKEQLKPKIPKFDGFRVISSVQSSKMSLVKNNIQRNIVYIFILAPTTIGNFKIGPATMKIESDTYTTDTFKIEVKERLSLPEQRQPESESPQVTL